MNNPRLTRLISGVFLGLAIAFFTQNNSLYAGNIISNYKPPEEESSMFKYFDNVSKKDLDKKINSIKEKAKRGKYINLDEMDIIANNCSQKTLEDAALCFFSSFYRANENGLKKIFLHEESYKYIDKISDESKKNKDIMFKIKPVKWADGNHIARMDHHMSKNSGGTAFMWFTKKDAKWYVDIPFALKNPVKSNRNLLKYQLFIRKEFAQKEGIKNSGNKEWVEVPKEIYKKMIKIK